MPPNLLTHIYLSISVRVITIPEFDFGIWYEVSWIFFFQIGSKSLHYLLNNSSIPQICQILYTFGPFLFFNLFSHLSQPDCLNSFYSWQALTSSRKVYWFDGSSRVSLLVLVFFSFPYSFKIWYARRMMEDKELDLFYYLILESGSDYKCNHGFSDSGQKRIWPSDPWNQVGKKDQVSPLSAILDCLKFSDHSAKRGRQMESSNLARFIVKKSLGS